MARPKEYDRQEILDKAMDVFWRQGYEATTLEDIIQETGFNRHSLYREFGNKDGLYQAVLANYDGGYWEVIGSKLDEGEPGLEALRNMFAVRIPNDVKGRGCLMTNTLNERECVSEDACLMAEQFVAGLEVSVLKAIRRAQREGTVPESKDAKALAKYVVTVLQGLGTMSKLGLTNKEAKAIARNTIALLQKPDA